jgi:hypothetical protein
MVPPDQVVVDHVIRVLELPRDSNLGDWNGQLIVLDPDSRHGAREVAKGAVFAMIQQTDGDAHGRLHSRPLPILVNA